MATTVAAVMTIINADTSAMTAESFTGRRGIAAWDAAPPPAPLTAAQRTTVCTAINGGTVVTLADVLALIATAATGGATQQQIWRIIGGFNDATLG
jgi:hypothetical protein